MAAAMPQFPGQIRETAPGAEKLGERKDQKGVGFKWSSLAHGSHERSLHTEEKHTHSDSCVPANTDVLGYSMGTGGHT